MDAKQTIKTAVAEWAKATSADMPVDRLHALVGGPADTFKALLREMDAAGELRMGKWTGSLNQIPAAYKPLALTHAELGLNPLFDGRTDFYVYVRTGGQP